MPCADLVAKSAKRTASFHRFRRKASQLAKAKTCAGRSLNALSVALTTAPSLAATRAIQSSIASCSSLYGTRTPSVMGTRGLSADACLANFVIQATALGREKRNPACNARAMLSASQRSTSPSSSAPSLPLMRSRKSAARCVALSTRLRTNFGADPMASRSSQRTLVTIASSSSAFCFAASRQAGRRLSISFGGTAPSSTSIQNLSRARTSTKR